MPPMPLPDPVIVLPGLTGSELRDDYALGPETVYSLMKKEYERVALHPDDLRFELKEPARVVPGEIFELPYFDLVAELRHNLSMRADQPVPVFPFPFDWRRRLDEIEAELAEFVDEVIARTRLLRHYHVDGYGSARPARVNLVGHSMGGLVLTGYLAREGFAKVGKVATLGSPFRGSHEAILKVATGSAEIGPTPGRPREREVARLTPALYYLLPTYAGAVEAEAGLSTDLFDPTAWQGSVVQTISEYVRLHGLQPANAVPQARALFGDLLAAARSHRTRLEELVLPATGHFTAGSWLQIVGVGEETRVRTRLVRGADGGPRFDLRPERDRYDRKNKWARATAERTAQTGDGTVPYLGARCAFLSEEQVVCVAALDFSYTELADQLLRRLAGLHAWLPRMNLVQRLVASHLLGFPQGQLWGRPAPGIASANWKPPIPGLAAK